MKKRIILAALMAMLLCLSVGNASDTTKTFGTKGTGTYSYVKTTTKTASVFPSFGTVNKMVAAKTTYKIVLSRSSVEGYDLRSNDGGLVTTPIYHNIGIANSVETSYTVSVGSETAEEYSVNSQVAESMEAGGEAFGFKYSVDVASTDGYAKTTTNSVVKTKSTTIKLDIAKDQRTAYYAYCYGTPFKQYRTVITMTSAAYGTVTETVYYNLPTTKTLALYLVWSKDCVHWTVAK